MSRGKYDSKLMYNIIVTLAKNKCSIDRLGIKVAKQSGSKVVTINSGNWVSQVKF